MSAAPTQLLLRRAPGLLGEGGLSSSSNKGIPGLEASHDDHGQNSPEHSELGVSASLTPSKHPSRSTPFINAGLLGFVF